MPLIEEYTFKLGDAGVILNTDSTSFPFVDITEVQGLDNAPYRMTERDHEGTDGGFMDAEFERGRPIVLKGTIFTNVGDPTRYMDLLKANYAPSRVLIPFYIKEPTTVERVVFAKPLGVRYDWQTLMRTGQTPAQFSLFAEDPRIYESSLSQVDIDVGQSATNGFGFDLGFNFGFGAAGSVDGAYVTNNGNRSTPLLFTIFGPANGPRIINDTLSQELQFGITLSGSQTLVVNTQYRTVKLDGSVNRRGTLAQPNWFDLEPGQNFIRYQSLDANPASHMLVEYRAAWR